MVIKIRNFFCLFIVLCLVSCTSSKSFAPVVRLGVGPRQAPHTYRVQRGDTLYSIAWTYGLDYHDLARVNHLSSVNQIHPGQVLRLKEAPHHEYVRKPVVVEKSKPFYGGKGWCWPVRGRIIKGFAPGLRGNAGIDIQGHLHETIRAARAGRVVYSGHGVRGYGNLIIIEHSNDFLSAYAFNSRNLVHLGNRVRAGQAIALMGRNSSRTPVLHFEIRQGGRPVDPLRFLRK